MSSVTLPLPLSKNQRKKAHRKARKNSTDTEADDCCPLDSQHSRHLTTSERLARLRSYLVPPPSLPPSIKPETWITVVSSLFRLVVLRVPSLAPLALDPSDGAPVASVPAFLDLLESRMGTKCGEEVASLWAGLRFAKGGGEKDGEKDLGCLGVAVLGDVIRAAARKEGEEGGVSVVLLGGKVYKEASGSEMTAEGWALFYQFVSSLSVLSSNSHGMWHLLLVSDIAWYGRSRAPDARS